MARHFVLRVPLRRRSRSCAIDERFSSRSNAERGIDRTGRALIGMDGREHLKPALITPALRCALCAASSRASSSRSPTP
jgi:hypothetical protein